MNIKKILSTFLASVMALATLGFSACNSNTLVVYTEAGFAPFEYLKDGKIVGVDVDIMNRVGEKLGKKVKFENVGFDTIIDTVQKGKLCKVGAAGISVTPERQAKVDFSNEYYTASLYVIYQKSEANVYESTTTDNVTGVSITPWGLCKIPALAPVSSSVFRTSKEKYSLFIFYTCFSFSFTIIA